MRNRILVSAGDASGDLILSKLIESLQLIAKEKGMELQFEGLCGPKAEACGAQPVATPKEVAVVGLWEVVRNLPQLFRVLGRLAARLSGCKLLLTVDFPDFNFRLADMAKKMNIPVAHVIAPQVWAWRSGRIREIPKKINALYPALPFEEELFKSAGLYTRYMGHPLRDVLEPRNRREARERLGIRAGEKLWVLLPGSRRAEIHRHFPLFIEALKSMAIHGTRFYDFESRLRAMKFGVGLAPGWTENEVLDFLNADQKDLVRSLMKEGKLIFAGHSHDLMMAGDFGWVASGTASLEAAFYQLPHILVYRLTSLSAFLIKRMSSYLRSPDARVGLPNILLGKGVIPELLQSDLTPKRLANETLELLYNESELARIRKDLRYLPLKMGEPGVTQRIAQDIFDRFLKN